VKTEDTTKPAVEARATPPWATLGTRRVVDGENVWKGVAGSAAKWAVERGGKRVSDYRDTPEAAVEAVKDQDAAAEQKAAAKRYPKEVTDEATYNAKVASLKKKGLTIGASDIPSDVVNQMTARNTREREKLEADRKEYLAAQKPKKEKVDVNEARPLTAEAAKEWDIATIKAAHPHSDVIAWQEEMLQDEPAEAVDAAIKLAAKMGVDPAQASHFLAEYLPKIVDKLTPEGKVDPTADHQQGLANLLPALLQSLGSNPRGTAQT